MLSGLVTPISYASLRNRCGPVAQRLEQGLIIQERVLARIFTALHAVADAGHSSGPVFATRCRDLRIFAAKMSQTVENNREALRRISLARVLVASEGAEQDRPKPSRVWSMTIWFAGARPIMTISQPNSRITRPTPSQFRIKRAMLPSIPGYPKEERRELPTRRSLVQGTTQKRLRILWGVGRESGLINETTQSGWRMIV